MCIGIMFLTTEYLNSNGHLIKLLMKFLYMDLFADLILSMPNSDFLVELFEYSDLKHLPSHQKDLPINHLYLLVGYITDKEVH